MARAEIKYCKRCIHLGKVSGFLCCNYIFNVGKRRPCPAGEGCTVKETRKRRSGGDHNRPDFKAINEQHKKDKAIIDKQKAIDSGLTAQEIDRVFRAKKVQKRSKGRF